MIDIYYKRITRIIEYYIFCCAIVITTVPLFDESTWVPGFIKFIYFTGFPLFIILIIASLIKDPILKRLKERFESSKVSGTPSRK